MHKHNLLTLTALAFSFLVLCGMKTVPAYQRDADIYRLKHLVHYASLIEGYKMDTGHYPFEQENGNDAYVFIVNDKQSAPPTTQLPADAKIISFADFVSEIERVKGEEIKEYYDPQYAADYKPNFYMYMMQGDRYVFAIHVHHPFSFAKKIAPYYYKVEISNLPSEAAKIWSPFDLFQSSEFQEELNREPLKPEYFIEREQLHIRDSKN